MSMNFLKTFGVAACLAAGVLGGMMINLLTARRRYAMAGGPGSELEESEPISAPVRSRGNDPFRELRRALLGRHRKQIVRVLGAPTTACIQFATAAACSDQPMTFWQATTWYYPFDQKQKKAIAIRFERDRAKEVEFIGAPG